MAKARREAKEKQREKESLGSATTQTDKCTEVNGDEKASLSCTVLSTAAADTSENTQSENVGPAKPDLGNAASVRIDSAQNHRTNNLSAPSAGPQKRASLALSGLSMEGMLRAVEEKSNGGTADTDCALKAGRRASTSKIAQLAKMKKKRAEASASAPTSKPDINSLLGSAISDAAVPKPPAGKPLL